MYLTFMPVPCNMTLYFFLNEDFLLMSSLPGCLAYSSDDLSDWSELLDFAEYFVFLLSLPCKQFYALS